MVWSRLIANAARAESRFILRAVDGQSRPPGKSAVLAGKTLARLLLYFPVSVQLAWALRRNASPCVLERNPGILVKHLRKGYVSRLSAKDRAVIVSHHYARLSTSLRADVLEALFTGGTQIWAASDDPQGPRIIAKSTDQYDFESEIHLAFMLGSEVLYVMGGVISPGALWDAQESSALVITRVQGIRLAVGQMKAATELCGDCAPRLLLFAAMEGLAAALRIREVIGVGVARQIATEFESITSSSFYDNYDGLWLSLNAQPQHDGHYRLPVPLAQRPLAAIAARHRGRAEARRTYRHIVTSAVASFFV